MQFTHLHKFIEEQALVKESSMGRVVSGLGKSVFAKTKNSWLGAPARFVGRAANPEKPTGKLVQRITNFGQKTQDDAIQAQGQFQNILQQRYSKTPGVIPSTPSGAYTRPEFISEDTFKDVGKRILGGNNSVRWSKSISPDLNMRGKFLNSVGRNFGTMGGKYGVGSAALAGGVGVAGEFTGNDTAKNLGYGVRDAITAPFRYLNPLSYIDHYTGKPLRNAVWNSQVVPRITQQADNRLNEWAYSNNNLDNLGLKDAINYYYDPKGTTHQLLNNIYGNTIGNFATSRLGNSSEFGKRDWRTGLRIFSDYLKDPNSLRQNLLATGHQKIYNAGEEMKSDWSWNPWQNKNLV